MTSTALLLGWPVSHALYLQATQSLHANTDIWAENLLNKLAHEAETSLSKQPTQLETKQFIVHGDIQDTNMIFNTSASVWPLNQWLQVHWLNVYQTSYNSFATSLIGITLAYLGTIVK